MVLYIHGFGSSAHSFKAKQVLEHCKTQGVQAVCPNLPTIPDLAVQTLCDWIEQTHPGVLIGSSLGGFYARWLAHRYGLPAVLINPALRPDLRLREAIPSGTQYYDGSSFEFNEQHCRSLESYRVDDDDQSNLWLLTQLGDEVLDAHEAIALVPGAKQTVEEDGDHSFTGFDRYLDSAIQWRGTMRP